MKSPFNNYDERGYRVTSTGCRSHRVEDEALLYNLRFKYPEYCHLGDAVLINLYDEFALSDQFGNNDENFPQWVKDHSE